MQTEMNRRGFVKLGLAAGAASLTPRWMTAQAAPLPDRIAQARAGALKTPIKTTKLADNVFLLQGAGGNMALQTGPEGNILIDASFASAVPGILEAIGAVSKNSPDALINTHWHFDHTDGNEGLHSAGCWIKPDVVFESSKIDQITFQSEGRHLIANFFFRVRRRFSDRRPYLL